MAAAPERFKRARAESDYEDDSVEGAGAGDALVVAGTPQAAAAAALAADPGTERLLDVIGHASYALLPMIGTRGLGPLMASARAVRREVADHEGKIKCSEPLLCVSPHRVRAWAAQHPKARALTVARHGLVLGPASLPLRACSSSRSCVCMTRLALLKGPTWRQHLRARRSS